MLIPAVVKDPGGTNGVLPVTRVLRESFGYDVRLVANGSAINMLSQTEENYEVLRSADEAYRRYPNPKVMLTSMCSEGGVGRDLVPILRGRCPTVAFHDYWGGYLFTDWRHPKYRPDFFVVNDGTDADIVMKAWPDYKIGQLIVTGYPMFDQYAVKYDLTTLLGEVSAKLGIVAHSKPIVLFPCGIHKGASKFLTEVIEVLNELGQDIFFIPRCHPRMAKNAPEEVELWASALQKFRGGRLVPDSLACTTQNMIRASTVVLSDYSTTLLEALLVRKPNISICYLEEVQKEYRESVGKSIDLMPDPPFVTLGCSARATDKVCLGQQILDAINGKLGLRDAQEKHFPLDGKNAQRAAVFISSIV